MNPLCDYRADTRSMEKFEPIAIVGVALRLPGGIRSPEALWEALIDKRSTRGLIPSDRYNIEAFYSPSRRVGSIGMQHGHFLSENLEHIDTSFFAMSQAEVGKVDPQQRMLLEVVWECMESGGQIGWKGTDIGVFAGCWGEVATSFS
jgi:acyl transferase domain-containing protein